MRRPRCSRCNHFFDGDRPNQKCCSKCLEKSRNRARQLRREGKCTACGKPVEKERTGRCRCKACSDNRPRRNNRSIYCYCTSLLVDGKCPYECPPEAAPDWLALQEHKRQERDEHARKYDWIQITAADMKRVRAAVAKFDPFSRFYQRRARKAGNKSHVAGARR